MMWKLHSCLCLCWPVRKEKTGLVSWSLTIPARIRVSLADDAAHFPCIFSPSALSLSCLIIYFMQLSCVIPWAGSWSTPFLESFKSLWNILKHSTPFLCNLQRQLSFPLENSSFPSPVLEIELAARVKSFPTKFEINKEFSFHSFKNFILKVSQ